MYQLIEDQAAVQDAIRRWREKMGTSPDGSVHLPELALWGGLYDRHGQDGRTTRYLNMFRIQEAPHPDAVQINIPAEGIDANVLGAVGEDESGRKWILRQGFLRPNGELGEVGLTQFSENTTLPNVEVTPAPTNHNRRYYAVACVEASPEEVQAATAEFVTECDLVRRRLHGHLTPAENDRTVLADAIRIAEGPPEERISSLRQAADAREIPQRQARIWRALLALLGPRMLKPRIDRLEMDLLIMRPGERALLVEIKTDNGAAAIQQGLGQLLLYGGLYQRLPNGSEAELVSLLPNPPRSPLVGQVLAKHRITVATYLDRDPPIFSREFLALCRCQA